MKIKTFKIFRKQGPGKMDDISKVLAVLKNVMRIKIPSVITCKTNQILLSPEELEYARSVMGENAKRTMKETRVPSTKMGRILEYGKIAVGMGFESAKESIIPSNQWISKSGMERLVSSLSRMRGAALKMGQMLSIQGFLINKITR